MMLMEEIRRSPVEVGSLSHDLQGLYISGGFVKRHLSSSDGGASPLLKRFAVAAAVWKKVDERC